MGDMGKVQIQLINLWQSDRRDYLNTAFGVSTYPMASKCGRTTGSMPGVGTRLVDRLNALAVTIKGLRRSFAIKD